MKAGVHFVMVREPISNWKNSIRCLCGTWVEHPQAVVMVDINERGLPERNSLRDCGRCWTVVEHDAGAGVRVYLYGLASAQEVMTEGV